MSQSAIFLTISAIIISFWAINTYISRGSTIRKVLNVVVVLALIAFFVNVFVGS
jgi:hypothetical protein